MLFLTTNGGFLSAGVLEALYLAALELVRDNERSVRISLGKGVGEGRLETEFKTMNLVTFSGPKFTSTLEIGAQTFRIEFIVDERYVREFVPGTWTTSRGAPMSAGAGLN